MWSASYQAQVLGRLNIFPSMIISNSRCLIFKYKQEYVICHDFCLGIKPLCDGKVKQVSSTFQTLGTKPIAHIDHFTPEMLGTAELVEEVNLDGSGKLVKVRIQAEVRDQHPK